MTTTTDNALPETTDMTGREIIQERTCGDPVLRPQVGDAATMYIGSDRYAGTIVAVSKSGKTVSFRDDSSRPAEGHDHYGTQKYTYHAAPEAMTRELSLRKSGSWRPVGSCDRGGYGLIMGKRQTYSDPHF